MISRGELKGQIYRLLMKTAKYPGFYKEEKVDDALQEAIDFVATEMFLSGEGWLRRMRHFTTTAGTKTIDIPRDIAMIHEVRYLFGDTYLPIIYDGGVESRQVSDSEGSRQYIGSYRIVDNAFYFNPPLAEGGTDYLQVEFVAFPKRLQSDQDFMDGQFNHCMNHFIKYRTATILASSIEKMVIPWAGLEQSWYEKMLAIVNKRNMQSTRIREYEG